MKEQSLRVSARYLNQRKYAVFNKTLDTLKDNYEKDNGKLGDNDVIEIRVIKLLSEPPTEMVAN